VQKTILLATCFLLASFAFAQAPMTVPSEMTVAGVKLKLNAQARKEIEETLDLLTRSQYHFQLKVDRSNLYMHFVEEVLREEGIPEDFKYLAIQEGEFISDAVSTSNAVGFWQFKKASAQELGVRVDRGIDERKHIIASTVGATKYLKRSNFVFDNWVLSMQSYLQGLTGTQTSVPDKWYGAKTMNITGKTHWYIKKYIAHKLAFQDFVGDGRSNPDLKLEAFEGRGKTLRQISQQVGVDVNDLKAYNTWLSQSRIPDDKSYMVIYPLKDGKQPVAQLNIRPKNNTQTTTNTSKKQTPRKTSSTPPKTSPSTVSPERSSNSGIKPLEGNRGYFPQITGQTRAAYEPGKIKMNGIPAIRAKSNENLNTLSKRTGISIAKLRKYNDIGPRGNVRADKYYYLKKKKRKGQVHYHVVQPGETLWGISQDYGIRLNQLLKKNRMRDIEKLKVGRVLWLRFIRPKNVPIEYADELLTKETARHRQKLLDDMNHLTKQEEEIIPDLDVSVDLEAIASLPEREVKPAPVRLRPKRNEKIVVHKVQPKETYFSLSMKYNVDIDDLLAWNSLRINDILKIGQELRIIVKETDDQKQ